MRIPTFTSFAFLSVAIPGAWAAASPATAPTLSVDRATPGVRLAWTGEGFLEDAPAALGPWSVVPGAVSPYTIPSLTTSQFFRIRQAFRLTVSVAGDGQGTVRSIPTGILCGDDCEELMASGATGQLTAEPAPGSAFAGWSGDCVGTGPCDWQMDGPKAVTATFTATPPEPSGFVNGDFEQGPGVGWLQDPSNMIYTAAELEVTPHSGNYAAWVGYHPDNRKYAAIGQRVTLPSTPPIYLNFAIWLYSEELCDPPWWDTFGIYVEGEALEENPRLCRGNTGGDGWRRLSYELSVLAGRTVLIGFAISSVDALASVALIDDVSISTAPW